VAPAAANASKKVSTMKIVVDDLSGPEIARFLDEHVQEMRSITPPESKHALDLMWSGRPDLNRRPPAPRGSPSGAATSDHSKAPSSEGISTVRE